MRYQTTALCLAAALALPLSACNNRDAQASQDPSAPTTAADTVVRQTVTVDGSGFHPDQIAAKAGQRVSLTFRRVTDATCGKEVVFKTLGINKPLPLNKDVTIEVTATGSPIGFACGMDMLKGKIVAQ